jgi:hypothetical protein
MRKSQKISPIIYEMQLNVMIGNQSSNEWHFDAMIIWDPFKQLEAFDIS